MDPSTPPVSCDLYCTDCNTKLTPQEVYEFRPNHDLMDEERENCRRMYEDSDEGVFVPLCDICYWGNDEEEDDEDDNSIPSSGSSHSCYCAGCGNEIDWDITEEEYEDENGNVLCIQCMQEDELTR